MTPDTVCLICGSPGHTSSSCQSEAAKALSPKPTHIARAHLPADSAFGSAYQSKLAPMFGKQDKRGQHMVGNGKAVTVVDTSKYAPKHPKAGKPVAGYRSPKEAKA